MSTVPAPLRSTVESTTLLEPDEQRQLSAAIQAGISADRTLQKASDEGRRLPVAERRQLRQLSEDGKAAADRFFNANLRLVMKFANRYKKYHPLEDLIQAGAMGLMVAIQKFNGETGWRFSTYGAWWIRQHMFREMPKEGNGLRLPPAVFRQVRKYDKTVDLLRTRLQREPTDDEVCEEMLLSREKLAEIQPATLRADSLDRPINMDGDGTLSDMVADPYDDDSTWERDYLIAETANEKLAQLTDRERQVVLRRFAATRGIPVEVDGEPLTQEKKVFALAMAKLRHPSGDDLGAPSVLHA